MQHVRLQCSDTLIARGTKKGSRSRLMREEAAVRRRESTPALLLLRWRAVLREQGSGCRGLELSHLLLHGTGLAKCLDVSHHALRSIQRDDDTFVGRFDTEF